MCVDDVVFAQWLGASRPAATSLARLQCAPGSFAVLEDVEMSGASNGTTCAADFPADDHLRRP